MHAHLLREIAELAGMPHADLKQEWRRLFHSEPPHYSKRLLSQRIAYKLQEDACGGLSKEAKARLDSYRTPVDPMGIPLVNERARGEVEFRRKWHGKTYVAIRTAQGFEFNGRGYRSLSAVAKKITGQHISGPHFFGKGMTVRVAPPPRVRLRGQTVPTLEDEASAEARLRYLTADDAVSEATEQCRKGRQSGQRKKGDKP